MVGDGKRLGDSVFAGHAAAGAAAISASTVAVHPLDTVKTLIQASPPPPPPPPLLLVLLQYRCFSQGLIWHLRGVFLPPQLGAAGKKQKMGLRQVVDRLMAASGPAGSVGCLVASYLW
jgi:hypothetical protein